jgi:hypothetical protein
MTPITNIALVLQSIVAKFKDTFGTPALNVVYDPSLTYETSVTGQRALRTRLELTTDSELPLMAFSRSPLRRSDELGRRSPKKVIEKNMSAFNYSEYKSLFGSFDFNYLFLTTDIRQIENFEILFYSEESLTSITELVVMVPGIGDWRFFLNWGEIDSFDVNLSGTYYKSLGGVVRVTGFYLTLLSDDNPLILEINQLTLEFWRTVLGHEQILAPGHVPTGIPTWP